MTENQIKVNSIEELVNKAKEFAASHGGTATTKIGHSAVNSGNYVYRDGKTVQDTKGSVEIELEGENNSSVKFFLEDKEEKSVEGPSNISVPPGHVKGICNHELYQKVIQELGKVDISHRQFNPRNKNQNDNYQPNQLKKQSYSVISVPCSSLQEVKDKIKEYYQKNQVEINQNPDFNQWVKTTYSHFGEETRYSKDGKEVSKVERDKNDFNFSLDNDEKDLLGQKENAPQNSARKSEIEQLKREIKALENNHQTNNDSEKQKELKDKREQLKNLEKEKNNTTANKPDNNNLLVLFSVGGVILLIGGTFLALAGKIINMNISTKKRFFTGIQATGTLTLGNYCGLIKHILKIQDDYEIIIMLADLHSLTIPKANFNYREKCYEIAALLYACGLKEENCKIFIQSQVKEHLELA
ncbi:13553_t:CDS:2 [Gigaspora margarita]|uniref:13553_t:CDS:1 n=1 Tax=Gigaspora margarita TaxID=4874 RepID=A0ABM8W008_GIGMA|nr:13553_t:CDS:2 [Gigaspora margarita]